MICQDVYHTTNGVAPVSIFDTSLKWSTINPGPTQTIQFTTANGQPPLCSPSNKPRFATIQFQCAATQGSLTLTQEPLAAGCAVAPGYQFVLQTPCACEAGCGSGPTVTVKTSISGGWVFIIILCVAFPLYFLIGFLYCWKVRGLQGTEACPNIAFWRDLPSLVKDGFMFVISKFKACCGSKGGGYDAL